MDSKDTLLEKRIRELLEKLEPMEPTDENYKATADIAAKLIDRAIEIEKIEVEHQDRVVMQKKEYDLKQMQAKNEERDRIIKNVLSAVGIVVSVGVPVWGTIVALLFEKEGTVTTIPGRKHIGSLFGRK